MKKIIGFTLVFFIILASTALAGPYLVCDPQSGILTYDVYADGTLIIGDHPAEPDGSLKYELTAPMPSIAFTAKAKNVWGASDESDPYISPPVAQKPLNLRLAE